MNPGEVLANPGASPAAIQSHYDLGNDFYRLWLDEKLNYSCAMWEPADTLDTAQVRKVDYHIGQARAEGKDRVLDVGCGWGAVLLRMVEVNRVSRAVGLTLSKAQADWISSLKQPQIEVRLESWTEHEPAFPYDGIISIGAFEHFARLDSSGQKRLEGYRQFFSCCRNWLKPRGCLSLQTFAYSGLRPREKARGSAGTQFLATEIFPETDPPTLTEIVSASDGILELVSLRNDRMDYGRTCREWLRRLRANRLRATAIAGEETVRRYERYLQLSTIGFETGYLTLFRITFAALR